jgi:hypothetical protein
MSLPQKAESPDLQFPVSRFLIAWFAISLIALVLMTFHVSEPAPVLGRYSTSFTVVLVAMLGVTGLAGGLAVLSRAGRLPHIRISSAWWF